MADEVLAPQRFTVGSSTVLVPPPRIIEAKKKATEEELISHTAHRLWPAAHVLAGVLHEPDPPVDCRGLSVLELGAGIGLTGIAAWRTGASVCVTDLEENLPALHRLVECNDGASASMRVEALDWRGPLPPAIAQLRPDVVLGADVVFWPALFDPLLNTLAALPGRPRVLVCVTDCNGRVRDFEQRAAQRGWVMRELAYRKELLPDTDDDGPEPDPQLFELSRKRSDGWLAIRRLVQSQTKSAKMAEIRVQSKDESRV